MSEITVVESELVEPSPGLPSSAMSGVEPQTAERRKRALDRRVYPVLFVDAMNVKIRDGQVANRWILHCLDW